MTDKQIIEGLEKEEVPINAVLAIPGQSKRLAWGGDKILETTFGDKIVWIEQKMERTTYTGRKGLLEKDPNIYFYYFDYGFDNSWGSKSHNTLRLICNKEMNTMIDLCGGLSNYLETLEDKDGNK